VHFSSYSEIDKLAGSGKQSENKCEIPPPDDEIREALAEKGRSGYTLFDLIGRVQYKRPLLSNSLELKDKRTKICLFENFANLKSFFNWV